MGAARLSLLFVAAGCLPTGNAVFPEETADSPSLLVVLEREGRVVHAAHTTADAVFRFSREAGDTLHLLEYAEALDLPPGPVPLDCSRGPDAHPGPDQSWRRISFERRRWVAEASGEWRETKTLGEEVARCWIPAESMIDCAAGGGCYPTDFEVRARICRTPCAVDAPQPPAEPMAPEPPRLSCPPRWTLEGSTQHPICRSPVSFTEPCAARFSELAPPNAVYVDPAHTSTGSGTITDPFRAFEDAVAVGASTIAVAAGTYGPAMLDVPVTLVGCGDATFFEDLRLGAGGTLDNVTLRRLLVTAGRASIRRARIVGDDGLTSTEEADLDLTDLAFENNGADGVRVFGRLVGRRIAFRSANGIRVIAGDVEVEDFEVRGGAHGFVALDGARVTLRRGAIEDLTVEAVDVSGGRLEVEDLTIVNTHYGISARETEVIADRVALHRVPFGIWVVAETGAAATRMSMLRDIHGTDADFFVLRIGGRGMFTVERVLAEGSLGEPIQFRREEDIQTDFSGLTAAVSDVHVRFTPGSTVPVEEDNRDGFRVSESSSVSVSRLRVENAPAAAILLRDRAVLNARDVTVVGANRAIRLAASRRGRFPDAPNAVLERVRVESSPRGVVVAADVAGEISDLTVRGADTGLETELGGDALRVERFELEGGRPCAEISADTLLDHGRFVGCEIGLRFDVRGDPARFLRRIRFEGTGVPLDVP